MIDEVQSARALDRLAGNAAELRRRAGLSQSDVGLRAGLHRTAVGMLERRLRMPRLDTILRIAGGVEAEPRELLEGLAWDLDRGRLWEARSDPGRYEVVVAGQTVTREAGRWKPVGNELP
jgi:transcriptional regulator with XRE-family HTH domain